MLGSIEILKLLDILRFNRNRILCRYNSFKIIVSYALDNLKFQSISYSVYLYLSYSIYIFKIIPKVYIIWLHIKLLKKRKVSVRIYIIFYNLY